MQLAKTSYTVILLFVILFYMFKFDHYTQFDTSQRSSEYSISHTETSKDSKMVIIQCKYTIEYLKCRADLNFAVDFGVNDAIGMIVAKWDFILFE